MISHQISLPRFLPAKKRGSFFYKMGTLLYFGFVQDLHKLPAQVR